jgi:hypothetical protein
MMKNMRIYLVLLFILFFISCGREIDIDPSVVHTVEFPTSRFLDNVVDIDGDNDFDLISRGQDIDIDGNTIDKTGFFINQGDLNFVYSSTEFTPNKTSDSSLGYRDFDQDGLVDIFFVDTGNKIVLLKNQGDLTFVEFQSFSTTIGNQELQSFAFSDTDNNGILDLIVVINNQQVNLEVIVFKDLQQNIILDIPIGLIEDRVERLTFVDLNNDGLLDFALKEPFKTNVFINTGDFNFTKTDTIAINGSRTITFSFVTDIDGDDLPDIWVDTEESNSNEYEFGEKLARTTFIFWNRGNGKFIKDGENLESFIPIDIDGDKDQDLLYRINSNTMKIKKNIGGKSFINSVTFTTPFDFFFPFIEDLNNDNELDWIFIVSENDLDHGKINILLGGDIQ